MRKIESHKYFTLMFSFFIVRKPHMMLKGKSSLIGKKLTKYALLMITSTYTAHLESF